jgi:hypothetical protein
MAAPQYIPVPPIQRIKAYESHEAIPDAWTPGRPGELVGRQPSGNGLGSQGPDQGYGLLLANRFRDRLCLVDGEEIEDALRGCLNIALRRASIYGRAPVIHDFTMAFTLWGFLDAVAPAELVALRRRVFEGVGNVVHHYAEGRAVADRVPELTLRQTPESLTAAYARNWRVPLGL